MPIFQHNIQGIDTLPNFMSHVITGPTRRKESEESIRTELCEGPVVEQERDDERIPPHGVDSDVRLDASQSVFDRVELMERLKRGESPTWSPNKHLETIPDNYDTKASAARPVINSACSPPLLYPAVIRETLQPFSWGDNEALRAGLSIERPQSALHTGDFTQKWPQQGHCDQRESSVDCEEALHDTRSGSWLSNLPSQDYTSFQQVCLSDPKPLEMLRGSSSTALLSSSFSYSFVFKPPTSPLARSESNDDAQYSSNMVPLDIGTIPSNNRRRHTLQSSQIFCSTPSLKPLSPYDRQSHSPRREHSTPYQAHQPRRSISSGYGLYQGDGMPQTPVFLRSSISSCHSDSSPLQLASMVGSYEESILRGRMSTTPSRPLHFVAQIGVLGLGKCKSSLRCPAHVTLTFPAVFYSYGTTSHGRVEKQEDGPSPYVGQIDLENGLPSADGIGHESKRRRPIFSPDERTMGDLDDQEKPDISTLAEQDISRARKGKRRCTSPKTPSGGSYRIPEKGQLQIIIKNPNKTAVKLFLVPYDLVGMESGTKTFIRQRSYSAGPVVDLPHSASSPQSQKMDSSSERAILRYLVHIHICCPSKGRFYLYKGIRVVFANRVPDGKESLRNEIQLPEPRFSVYKPNKESSNGFSANATNLTAEKTFRRRSSGFALNPSRRGFDAIDGITHSLQAHMASDPHHSNACKTPVESMPFSLFHGDFCPEDEESRIHSPMSNKSSQSHHSASQDSGTSAFWNSTNSDCCGYGKLNRGDVGYGGNAFAGIYGGRPAAAEGLLANKLWVLDVGRMG